ncbi:uncharacterized protein CANTADRAFT_211635 [Suhomyces tanzawaensis NRRL Y-17324]|uniref:Protein ECM13 n=1 Tax=Suhomyces tanzawaensis NRRL Y-17324 TaxID=984487 RepID=A0A1E4SJQ0_9ASCO|nr:uncharacterized protein CANTADRAFT_211635 [Suhomyces tanzawaensis NRRL Y-17324]ODV79729.1 hypothetical protein CANTADRAFT_211635 [Suhomyces tanzawaensis NRRL Y-17324]
MSNMSFAQSYILASKVRTKLTKEAANPRSSLRNLVMQANMLDNIMDHISEETHKRSILKKEKEMSASAHTSVTFSVPNARREEATSVTEYEVGSDSDDDDEIDYEYHESDDSDFSDSDEDDYYYSSDEEDEEEDAIAQATVVRVSSFKELPSMNLSLSRIEEEDGLCRTLSLTDDEEEEELDSQHKRNFTHTAHGAGAYNSLDEVVDASHKTPRTGASVPASLFEHQPAQSHSHSRNNAIYSMEHIF